MPLKSLVNVYHSLFASHMRYACQLWGLRDNSVTHRILTLQKAALRLITFSEPRSPSAPIFAVLEILKFFDLVEVLNILLVHQHFSKVHHSFCTRGKSLGLPSSLNANTSKFGLKSKTVYIYIYSYFFMNFIFFFSGGLLPV